MLTLHVMTQPTPKPATTSKQQQPVRTLTLVKGQHRFSFSYETGEEPAVLDALVAMVHRREMPFDWFDAAVLSHQLGQHLAKELMGYLPKKAA
jgi:hypothetical protein